MNTLSLSFFLRMWNILLITVLTVSLAWAPVIASEINENVLVIKDGKSKKLVADEGEAAEEVVGKKEKTDDGKIDEPTSASAPEPPELPSFEDDSKKQEEPDADKKKTLMIVGAGVAGAAALALALGGGGGSSAPAPPPQPVETFDGPDVSGDWTGELDLVTFDSQAVGATIIQNGENITIHTTSTLPYGRDFVGTMDEDGSILAYDQETGEDWTTFEGNATNTSLKLFDWVSTTHELDSLKLHR